jgi:hypothetical protein
MFAPTESFATLTDPQEQAIVQLNLQACKLVRKGKIDDAVNLLRRARHACIRDKSRFKDKYKRKLLHATTLNNLGCAVKQNSEIENALEYFTKALRIEVGMPPEAPPPPNPAGTHLNICAMLSKLKRHREARKHAKCALKLLKEGRSPKVTTDGAGQTSSVLALAHHNLAVEQEYLNDYKAALNSYMAACHACLGALGEDHKLTKAIHKNANAALGTIEKKLAERDAKENICNHNRSGDSYKNDFLPIRTKPGMGTKGVDPARQRRQRREERREFKGRSVRAASSSTSSSTFSLGENSVGAFSPYTSSSSASDSGKGFNDTMFSPPYSSSSNSSESAHGVAQNEFCNRERDESLSVETVKLPVKKRTSRAKTFVLLANKQNKRKPAVNTRTERLERGGRTTKKARRRPQSAVGRSKPRRDSKSGGRKARPTSAPMHRRRQPPAKPFVKKHAFSGNNHVQTVKQKKYTAAKGKSRANAMKMRQQVAPPPLLQGGMIFRPPSLEKYKKTRPKSATLKGTRNIMAQVSDPTVRRKTVHGGTSATGLTGKLHAQPWGDSVAASTTQTRKLRAQLMKDRDKGDEGSPKEPEVANEPSEATLPTATKSPQAPSYLSFLNGGNSYSISNLKENPRVVESETAAYEEKKNKASEEIDLRPVCLPLQAGNAAAKIQSAFRKFRIESEQIVIEKDTPKSFDKGRQERIISAIKIQAVMRGSRERRKRTAEKSVQGAKTKDLEHNATQPTTRKTAPFFSKMATKLSSILKARKQKMKGRALQKKEEKSRKAEEALQKEIERQRNISAVRLQSGFRRYRAVRLYTAMKCEHRLKVQRENAAAVVLQCYIRMIRAIKKKCIVKELNAAAIKIQGCGRRHIATKRCACLRTARMKARDQSAIVIQNQWRTYNSKMCMEKLRGEFRRNIESRAALTIQCMFRVYCARVRHRKKLGIQRCKRKKRNVSATKIQNTFRCHAARKLMHSLQTKKAEELKAAVVLQAFSRKQKAVRLCNKMRTQRQKLFVALKMQTLFRGRKGRRLARKRSGQIALGAATNIQRQIRMFLAMKRYRDMQMGLVHRDAVVKIQSNWRSHIARRSAQKRRNLLALEKARRRKLMASIVLLQSLCRGLRARQMFRDMVHEQDSAVVVQKHVRSMLARNTLFVLKKKTVSAKNIQRVVRGHLGRNVFYSLYVRTHAAVVIAKNVRQSIARKRFIASKRNIIVVQSLWRSKINWKIVSAKREEREKLLSALLQAELAGKATSIQAWWRGLYCRHWKFPDLARKREERGTLGPVDLPKCFIGNHRRVSTSNWKKTAVEIEENEHRIAAFALEIVDAIRLAEGTVLEIEQTTLGISVLDGELWRELASCIHVQGK